MPMELTRNGQDNDLFSLMDEISAEASKNNLTIAKLSEIMNWGRRDS